MENKPRTIIRVMDSYGFYSYYTPEELKQLLKKIKKRK